MPEGDVDSKGDPGVIDGVEEAVGGTARVPSVLGVAAEAPESEGAAEDPLAKAPVPHGMFMPSGWVDWEGGTLSLAESVIVKRPVQVLFEVDGDVN